MDDKYKLKEDEKYKKQEDKRYHVDEPCEGKPEYIKPEDVAEYYIKQVIKPVKYHIQPEVKQ